jgi:hypothetical protein
MAVVESAAPVPGAWDADRRFGVLDERLREWAGVNAATAALVEVIAAVDAEGLWQRFGFRSLELFVSLRCGVSFAHAKRLVATARGLEALPLVRAGFAAGAVSEDQVFAIAQAGVTGFHDRDAALLAGSMTVAQLRKALSFLPRVDAEGAPLPDPEPDPGVKPEPGPSPSPSPSPGPGPREWVRYGPNERGVWEMSVGLSPERGELVEKAIDAARDREYRLRHGEAPDSADPPLEVSNVDALLRLCGDGLDVADPATRAGKPPSDRYLVNVHLEHSGACHLHLGPGLDASTRDELCCDAQVRSWLAHPDGSVGLGRRGRVVSPRLRLVVEHRDGGCAVPGCASRKHLRVHHIVHWLHDGVTETFNLVCLCPAHHRDVHRGDIIVRGNPDLGTLQVADRSGRPYAVGGPIAPTDGFLQAAMLRATGSPHRPGEQVMWWAVDWTDPRPRPARPKPPAPPPSRDGPPLPPMLDPRFGWHLLNLHPHDPDDRRRRRRDDLD